MSILKIINSIKEYFLTDKELFYKLVNEEAFKLRCLLKEEEADNLNIENLNGINSVNCIYGQLTGNYASSRGIFLAKASNTKVYRGANEHVNTDVFINKSTLSDIGNRSRYSYMTPIEVFILNGNNKYNGNNEKLVRFLKREIHSLDFV